MKAEQFYQTMVETITSSLDIGKALENSFSFLRTLMDVDLFSLFYYDFDKEGIYCLAETGVSGTTVAFETPIFCGGLPSHLIQPERSAEFVRKLQLPEINMIPKEEMEWYYENNPIMKQRYGEFMHGSVLRLWLYINNDMTGTLILSSRHPNAFSSRATQLLQSVRQPITMAMSNARRYQELLVLKSRLEEDNRALRQELRDDTGSRPVGVDFGLRDVMRKVMQVAATASPVLLLGETGTGKEVIANTVHQISNRRNGPMVKVSCGAFPEGLLDSELFGHEKGAFTGALTFHRGRFERADNGTLFLDEIGELTPNAQVKLLRVLQENKIERLGGDRPVDINVRIIAATNRNLENMIRNGEFREDLWYRLNVFPIHIPPLRLRKMDIPSLVSHFVLKKSREMNLRVIPTVHRQTIHQLTAYHWPGNVRELQNVIERALILNPGPILTIPESFLTDYHSVEMEPPTHGYMNSGHVFPNLNDVQTEHIKNALVRCHGVVNGPDGAARLLKINPNTLRARMRKLGIPHGRQAHQSSFS
ncbi:sigma 54-interacting transcriptional regulator [bacterium]|nr:sigma 54-interacting transcriptional regulator [candidate division CSSED10-310 bacterium]